MQDLLVTCTRYVPFHARFLHAHILQEMVQDFARDAARIVTCKFAHFLQDLARMVQDCARIVQEKEHIACTCQASFACKILAQSCKFVFAGKHKTRGFIFTMYGTNCVPNLSRQKSGTDLKLLWQLLANVRRMDIIGSR